MSNAAIDSDDADTNDRPDCTCDYFRVSDCPIHGDEAREHIAFYTVAIFMVDRAYGGPEEGGWHYEYGTRIDEQPEGLLDGVPATFRDESKAILYRAIIQRWLDAHMNVDLPEISSVLSRGRYQAQVHPLYPPRHYPETRPHYE